MKRNNKTKVKKKEDKFYNKDISFVLYAGFIFLLLFFLGTLANTFYEDFTRQGDKNKALERELIEVKQKLNSITTTTPTPTAIKQQVITQNIPVQKTTPTPTRNKTSFTTKYLEVNGTYACYEDTLSQLSAMEQKLYIREIDLEDCREDSSRDNRNCLSDCDKCVGEENFLECRDECTDKCLDEAKDSCDDEAKDFNNLREDYKGLLKKSCPGF